MTPRSWTGRAALLAPVITVAVLLGCSDLMGTEQTPTEESLAGAEPGIHPVLVIRSESAGEAMLELHLKQVDVRSTVASYQGELEYATEGLTLVEAGVPAGITGSWNEVEKGRIRFAGVSLSGIAESAVLTLHFAAKGSIDEGAFRLRMEEITGTENFQDLTATVRQAERPLLSRSPVR